MRGREPRGLFPLQVSRAVELSRVLGYFLLLCSFRVSNCRLTYVLSCCVTNSYKTGLSR